MLEVSPLFVLSADASREHRDFDARIDFNSLVLA